MTKGNDHSPHSLETTAQATEWPEKMNLTHARRFLGISFSKMTMLVRSGILKYEQSPLDYRMKFVKRSDLEQIKLEHTEGLANQQGRSDI
jgi:hypothetical protein